MLIATPKTPRSLIRKRIGLTSDWPRVFAEAAKLDKAIEVDSYPDRQDIDLEITPPVDAAWHNASTLHYSGGTFFPGCECDRC
jgi:hypothetical protein